MSETDYICQECNQYSWLDEGANTCVCVFVYKVEISAIPGNNNESQAE